jgi:hypothetical protein
LFTITQGIEEQMEEDLDVNPNTSDINNHGRMLVEKIIWLNPIIYRSKHIKITIVKIG